MKWLYIIVAAIAIVLCSGCGKHYKIVKYAEVLQAGQTVEDVVSKYYHSDNSGESWDEFRYRQFELNNALFKNRCPQVGDLVTIEVRK